MNAHSRPPVLPQAVLDAMPGAVAQLSAEGEILGVNAAWRTLAVSSHLLTGTKVTPGSNYLTLCDEAAAAGLAAAGEAAKTARDVLAGRTAPAPLVFTAPATEGERWFELVFTRLDGNAFRGALVTLTDVTSRQTATEAQRRSDIRYREIFESAPVGIYQLGPDKRILAANQCMADIVGVPSPGQLIGTPIARFDPSGSERELPLADGVHAPVEIEWRRIDDTPVWVELAARAITDGTGGTMYLEGFVYDISERKQLEAQLVQAQKMESVGRLAGGIAHDFNNLLTVMIGYAELLNGSDDLPPGLRNAAVEILEAARRAAELTGRMLAFARKHRVEPRAVNVNDVVRGVETLLRRIIGEDIRLEVHLASDLPPVLIDPAQMEQVLMNLAVNARDAMPSGGVVTIVTDVVEVSSEEARRRPGLRPGRQVKVSLADTGVGMDAETLARIFEPFFTTKEPGKGTGLGLAMCYGIVKQANGFIGCESMKGVGTTCMVMLPATSGTIAPSSVPERPAESVRPATSRRATILVVEDEAVVRQFVADVLMAAGHVVHATGSPREGLDIASQRSDIDLLVTDVVMPQMDGVALAARIRSQQPKLRVLLMSGYEARPVPTGDGATFVLGKPFTASQLLARVAEALDSDADRG